MAGLAELDRVAAFVEARLREVQDAFGVAGSSRRPKLVHRPLPFAPVSVKFDGEGPAMGLLSRLELAQLCARRLFNIGYDATRLARIVSALPPRLMLALRRLVVAAQQEHRIVAQAPRLAMAGAAQDYGGVLAAPSLDTGGEYDLWELETELGLVAFEVDPATQRRVRLTCNSRAAQLWGQHREEFLARFSAHDGQIQFTDLAAACRLATEMRAVRDDDAHSYLPFTFGTGRATRAVLACQRRHFDSLGRVAKVLLYNPG